ncbi:MAG: hypothetical protein IKI45_04055 [Oscillospiraceae bacterium]|nr:hypothetical protein [Oscillospiraceae bacterium]
MPEKKQRSRKMSIGVIVWSNIVRQQYLLGFTDEQISKAMGISIRSYYNYQQDPSLLTMKHIQALLDNMGIDIQTLIIT